MAPPTQDLPPRGLVLHGHMSAIMAKEIEGLAAKNAIVRAPKHEGGFMSPQSRQRVETGSKPQITKPICGFAPFQNGVGKVSKEPGPARRLVGQTRPQRCVPNSTYTSSSPWGSW